MHFQFFMFSLDMYFIFYLYFTTYFHWTCIFYFTCISQCIFIGHVFFILIFIVHCILESKKRSATFGTLFRRSTTSIFYTWFAKSKSIATSRSIVVGYNVFFRAGWECNTKRTERSKKKIASLGKFRLLNTSHVVNMPVHLL